MGFNYSPGACIRSVRAFAETDFVIGFPSLFFSLFSSTGDRSKYANNNMQIRQMNKTTYAN